MKRIWGLAAACLVAGAAAANDSTAETSAGGLVLTRSDLIDMVSEDLFVSADAVRVAYRFRNRSARPVTTLVAFPMPDRDLAAQWYGDVAFPSGFETRVEGKPVSMRVERKALLEAKDHAPLLEALGVPLSGYDEIVEAMNRLPTADKARLVRLGLAAEDDDGPGSSAIVPRWTVRETWFWEQSFPVGRDLQVEHSYTPGTGGSVDTALAYPDFRASREGRRMMTHYCVDRPFLAGLDRLRRRSGGVAPDRRVAYVLKTGANWRSPIGRFRLVVDKGAAANIVSFCGEGVRRISPTRFEMVKTNWRPDRDLAILIVESAKGADR